MKPIEVIYICVIGVLSFFINEKNIELEQCKNDKVVIEVLTNSYVDLNSQIADGMCLPRLENK